MLHFQIHSLRRLSVLFGLALLISIPWLLINGEFRIIGSAVVAIISGTISIMLIVTVLGLPLILAERLQTTWLKPLSYLLMGISFIMIMALLFTWLLFTLDHAIANYPDTSLFPKLLLSSCVAIQPFYFLALQDTRLGSFHSSLTAFFAYIGYLVLATLYFFYEVDIMKYSWILLIPIIGSTIINIKAGQQAEYISDFLNSAPQDTPDNAE